MARYLAALAGGGANSHGRVLEPATLATMFEPHYQTDPRVPGIGLAFMRSCFGAHLAVEHQGILPGFNSQIWLAPDDGFGVMAFTNGTRGAMIWLMAEVAGLLKQLLGVPDEVIRTDVPHHPEIWGDLCGWYPVSAQLTDNQARGVAGLGAEVFIRRGQLTLRALSPIPSSASAPRRSCSAANPGRGRHEYTPTCSRSHSKSSPPATTRGRGSPERLARLR
jgi:hypothetical protein